MVFLKLHQNRIETLLQLNGSTIKVYLAILHHADIENGICWPGYRKLSKMTGVTSRKRLKDHIDILIDNSLLERWDDDSKFSYRIIW